MNHNKKLYVYGLLLCVLIITATTVSIGMRLPNNQKKPKDTPKDYDTNETPAMGIKTSGDLIPGNTSNTSIPAFSFTYAFGVGQKNLLDTQNNLYRKDMICDPSKDYTIQLTNEELTAIYVAVIENDLFSIKNNLTRNWYDTGITIGITPLFTASLTIVYAGKIKTIVYAQNYYNPNDPDVIKFLSVTQIISKILQQKENQLRIEQPRCGYI